MAPEYAGLHIVAAVSKKPFKWFLRREFFSGALVLNNLHAEVLYNAEIIFDEEVIWMQWYPWKGAQTPNRVAAETVNAIFFSPENCGYLLLKKKIGLI